MAFSLLILASFLFPTIYASIGPHSTLYVANKVVSPDGYTGRVAALAGGSLATLSLPGPLIAANKDDSFSINVVNYLTDKSTLRSTTIHWHGLFQKGTNWADGPDGVTQCPIAPSDSFLYQFTAPGQAGTFWYHSHYAVQYCDGLRGPLVIYDPNDPHKSRYDVDNESTVITLSEWYHQPTTTYADSPTLDAALINGKGRYPGGPPAPLTIINVQQHVRYRLRIVSISCDPAFILSIDSHTFDIIETDGVNVEPYNVDSILIFPGQRYSIVLNANQPINNYWLRILPDSGPQNYNGGINSAIVRYLGAPLVEPTTSQYPNSNPMVETNLHPLSSSAVPGKPYPGGADVTINLGITTNANGQYIINGATFSPPTVPVLLQILSGAHSPQELLPKGDVYVLPPNKVIEVSIPGGSADAPHPFHLHGHNFYVVRSAGNSSYNYVNPVIRDVVSTGDVGDNTTIRFVTDNAGPWIFHCHIDWHLKLGLAVVFAENVPAVASENPPAAWDQLCPIYDRLPSNQH